MGPKLEDFEVIDTIGQGSYGIIKKVKRKSDGLILVWKELHYASMNEAEKQGLVLEVNLLRELHHPNIVRFLNYLVDRPTGTLFMFMEYCSGGDLHHLIKKCRKTGSYLEEGFIWKVLKQVCSALRLCHEKKPDDGTIILHRDIKPANVFLDEEGNVKLGDFGLARTLNSNASFAKTFVGTPYYMSPEVIDGREYNERSDIWSLGCLIYELCTLEPPFKAPSQNELKTKINAGRYKRIPIHYSNALWEIVQEMLRQDEFLRPSAFMLLQESPQDANTRSREDKIEEDLWSSIAVLFRNQKNGNGISCDSNDSQSLTNDTESLCTTNSFESTVKEKELSDKFKEMEESLMREVEELLKESQLRKEIEREERLQGNPLDLNLLDSSVSRKNVEPNTSKPEDGDQSQAISLSSKIQSPPCVCGGISLEEWKERVRVMRTAEESVRQRELALEEKERELSKKEHRLHSMEKEVKQHLVRAQIYLKQVKSKGQNVLLAPRFNFEQEVSDLDATTVSADIGYDQTPTVAFLDTQPQNNPFLKMRENFNKKIQPVSRNRANTNLSRSNTLDNPKSRRKNEIYYYLEKSGDKSYESEQMKRKSYLDYCANANYLKSIENNSIKDQMGPIADFQHQTGNGAAKPKLKGLLMPNQKILEGDRPNCKEAIRGPSNRKENSGTILSTLRQNLMRNNGIRKSANSKVNKENHDVHQKQCTKTHRMPLKVLNAQKCQPKGVSIIPEIGDKLGGNGKQNSFIYSKVNKPSTSPRRHFFRFYNAV